MREKYTNTEFFLVRIFLYLVWIQGDAYQKKLHIWALFTQWNDQHTLDIDVSRVTSDKGRYTYDVHENCPIPKNPHPLVQLRPRNFHPLDLGLPVSNKSPPLQMIINQLKENKMSFLSSSNSEKMCWSWGWAEASLSAFLRLSTLLCAAQKYHKLLFIYNYSNL